MKQIEAGKLGEINAALTGILADMFVLYYKTHGYHWNVEGVHFKPLHDLFEEQYTDLWGALDTIAERIRALDAYAPISVKALMGHASLKEASERPDSFQMVRDLAADHETLSQRLAAAISLSCDAGDDATADLLTQRLGVHEKMAWMLKATAK